MAQTHQPAYRAFTVVKREGQDDTDRAQQTVRDANDRRRGRDRS
jgi:hypothetical protein